MSNEAQQQKEFEDMLLALSSADNATRKYAEEVYNKYKSEHRAWTLSALTAVGCTSANPASAQMGLVLLRRALNEEGCVAAIDANSLEFIKGSLLTRMGEATLDKGLRKAAASSVSALAGKLSEEGGAGWPDLWTMLVSTLTEATGTPEVRGACCDIFGQVASTLATTYFATNMGVIAGALKRACKDADPKVRAKAFGAVVNFSVVLEDAQVPAFRELAPVMLESVKECITHQQWETAKDLCSCVAAVCETQSEVFHDRYTELLLTMTEVAKNPQVAAEARHMSIEVVISLAEGNPKALKKIKGFVPTFFGILFSYLLNPAVDNDWATTYGGDDDTADETDFDVGATSIDRFAVATKGRGLQGPAQETIMANIASPNWQNRNAALTVLTYVVEGCKKAFREHLASIVPNLILPRFQDENPVVRCSAVQAIAQFCDDFSPTFQIDYASIILPPVISLLSDAVPRIQAQAIGTLNMFLGQLDEKDDEDEKDPNEFMWPYVEPMTRELVRVLHETPHMFVKKEIFVCLSSLIEVSGKQMTPFVQNLVPLLQEVITATAQSEVAGDEQVIKCRAIENLTLLACSVGYEAFAPYAEATCQYLSQVLGSGLKNDDMRLRYILRGWTCMVECLKERILPYLDNVMGPLIAVADMQCDVEVAPRGIGEDSDDEEDENIKIIRVTVPGQGEQTMRLHTSLVEDKDLAATILLSFLQELKGKMAPYLPSLTKTGCELLTFKAYAETRDTAAEMLENCAYAYKEADPSQLVGYLHHIAVKMWSAIQAEPDTTVAGQMIKSFGKALSACPKDSLPSDVTDTAGKILLQVFAESVKRIQEVNQQRATLDSDDEGDEGEDLDEQEEDEDFFLSECIECVQAFIKNCQSFHATFVNDFLPVTNKLVDPMMTDNEHRLGLCLLCDFVEFGGATALPHLTNVSRAFLHYATADDEDVQQAGAYGVGIVCEVLATHFPGGNDQANEYARNAYNMIGAYLVSPAARTDERIALTANMISSALKVIQFFGAVVDGPQLFTAIVPLLPCRVDHEESVKVHDKLVQWLSDPSNPLLDSASPHRAAVIAALKLSKDLSPEAIAALTNMA